MRIDAPPAVLAPNDPSSSVVKEVPYRFDASPLVPPRQYKAGPSSDWVLVGRSQLQQGDVVLAKVMSDGGLYCKTWPMIDLCNENGIRPDEVAKSIQEQRYENPNAEEDGEKGTKWSYGGVYKGQVILYETIIEDPELISAKQAVRAVKLSIGEFEGMRDRTGKSRIVEGSRRKLDQVVPIQTKKFEFYEAELESGPIEGNILRVKAARLLPDVHAGNDPNNPYGNMLDNLRPDEVVIFQELIDRGAAPWEVVDRAVDMVKHGKAAYIIGNHESMFLAAMQGDSLAMINWLIEGGDKMLLACDPKVSSLLRKIDMNDPMGKPQESYAIAAQILDFVQRNPGMAKVRDFDEFLRKNGKMYVLADGLLAVHAGVPGDKDGNLVEMKGAPKYAGKVGFQLLDAMQKALRENDKEGIIQLYSGGGGSDEKRNNNPLWMRDPWFNLTDDPNALHRLREQMNGQLAQMYPGYDQQVEAIAVGHTPKKVDERRGTHSLDTRALFIDGGFYRDGTQRILLIRVPDDIDGKVEFIYKDPSGRNAQVRHEGMYELH